MTNVIKRKILLGTFSRRDRNVSDTPRQAISIRRITLRILQAVTSSDFYSSYNTPNSPSGHVKRFPFVVKHSEFSEQLRQAIFIRHKTLQILRDVTSSDFYSSYNTPNSPSSYVKRFLFVVKHSKFSKQSRQAIFIRCKGWARS